MGKVLAKNVKRPIGFAGEKTEKVVTRINLLPTIDADKLYEQVALRTGRPKAAVKDVLENTIEATMTFLSESHGVCLGDLGRIYPAIRTKADEDEDNCKVTAITVRLLPSLKLKRAVSQLGVSVTKLDGTISGGDDDTTGGDTTPTGGDNTPAGGDNEGDGGTFHDGTIEY